MEIRRWKRAKILTNRRKSWPNRVLILLTLKLPAPMASVGSVRRHRIYTIMVVSSCELAPSVGVGDLKRLCSVRINYLAILGFGLGTMIYIGLQFGLIFEIPFHSPCYELLRALNPVLQMVFTFMQMYFIFMNARVSGQVTRYPPSRFFAVLIKNKIFSWRSIASNSSLDLAWCTWWRPIYVFGLKLWYTRV